MLRLHTDWFLKRYVHMALLVTCSTINLSIIYFLIIAKQSDIVVNSKMSKNELQLVLYLKIQLSLLRVRAFTWLPKTVSSLNLICTSINVMLLVFTHLVTHYVTNKKALRIRYSKSFQLPS